MAPVALVLLGRSLHDVLALPADGRRCCQPMPDDWTRSNFFAGQFIWNVLNRLVGTNHPSTCLSFFCFFCYLHSPLSLFERTGRSNRVTVSRRSRIGSSGATFD